jgi:hypothetical protein
MPAVSTALIGVEVCFACINGASEGWRRAADPAIFDLFTIEDLGGQAHSQPGAPDATITPRPHRMDL